MGNVEMREYRRKGAKYSLSRDGLAKLWNKGVEVSLNANSQVTNDLICPERSWYHLDVKYVCDTLTRSPTDSPTTSPTKNPTKNPTASPTTSPTKNPTKNPPASPTVSPTDSPTYSPTPECSPSNC